MKLLIIGCGSIGARHARNAKSLAITDFVLCDTNAERAQALADDLENGEVVTNLDEALTQDVSAAIIATPSSLHVDQASTCIERGIAVFLEKPLAVTRDGLPELVALADRKKVVSMVGQSFRFHQGVVALKRALEKEPIGKIERVTYDWSSYLPAWHPEQDYRQEYTARKSLGGGVLLTNGSHSFDTAEYVFGTITSVEGWAGTRGDLELETGVDDTFCGLLRVQDGTPITMKIDFASRHERHVLRVIGTQGYVEADFITHTIKTEAADQTPESHTYSFDPNTRYVEELRHFLDLIEKKTLNHDLDLHHGAHIVELLTDPRIEHQ